MLLLEQRGVAFGETDPKNPAYYQVQAFCQNGAAVAAGSLRTGWTGIAYNDFPKRKTFVSFKESCTDAGTAANLPGFEKCFSGVRLVPLASGHAEINKPSKLEFTIDSAGKAYDSPDPYRIPGDPQYFFLNNRSVPYPVVHVQPNWGPSSYEAGLGSFGVVPPPVNPPYVRTFKDCGDNFDGASAVLGKALTTAGFPEPDPEGEYDAHHIKPLCFEGTNDAANGVWLPNGKAPIDLHRPFTTWFFITNFTP